MRVPVAVIRGLVIWRMAAWPSAGSWLIFSTASMRRVAEMPASPQRGKVGQPFADAEVAAFRCRLPDRPGSLAQLLGDLADLGANMLEVGHELLGPRLHVDEAGVFLVVETRGPGHCEEVTGALHSGGYTLAFSRDSARHHR